MQASGTQAQSAPFSASGMLWYSGLILVTLEAAVCCDGTGRSSRSHHSLLIAMVGGVSPAKMSREKAIMWPPIAVVLE